MSAYVHVERGQEAHWLSTRPRNENMKSIVPKTLKYYFCFPRPSLGVPLRPFASTLRYRYRQRLLAPPRSKKGAVQALLSFDDGKAQVSRLSNIRTCSQRWPR